MGAKAHKSAVTGDALQNAFVMSGQVSEASDDATSTLLSETDAESISSELSSSPPPAGHVSESIGQSSDDDATTTTNNKHESDDGTASGEDSSAVEQQPLSTVVDRRPRGKRKRE